MQISSFVSDSYIINLCLGYQLCLICPLILLYFLTLLHRNPGIFSPYVWTLPSKSYLPFCLKQEYSYLCGQGGDVTLGMDVISRLDVQISGRTKDAKPRMDSGPSEILKMDQKVVIPAGKSRVFFLANTVAELTLFEPSDRLPEGLLGLPIVSKGSKVAIQLDNLTEGDITLVPEWEVGTISSVHLAQTSTGGKMPQIPDSLSFEEQRDLRQLIKEYQDVFSKEGNPISSTSMGEHEIHTMGRLSGCHSEDRTLS